MADVRFDGTNEQRIRLTPILAEYGADCSGFNWI